jgi:uncharacterized protein YutE (UPF0331/DUF86 family)
MVKRDVVIARLQRLQDYLATLKTVQTYDLERFKSDPFIHGTAERYLHLAIECLLDIGNHVIADRGFRRPETYGEVLEILSERGVVPADLAKEMSGMASFRNVLVHDYLRLDLDLVHRVLNDHIKHFEALATIYGDLL